MTEIPISTCADCDKLRPGTSFVLRKRREYVSHHPTLEKAMKAAGWWGTPLLVKGRWIADDPTSLYSIAVEDIPLRFAWLRLKAMCRC